MFRYDGKLFQALARLADILVLNIICIICCIPVFTIGASLTALYTVTLKMVKNEESYIVRSFFKAFKDNFKEATICTLIMLVGAGVISMDFYAINIMSEPISSAFRIGLFVLLILYMFIYVYLFPLVAKFINPIRKTFSNAFLMSVRHLPYTILMLFISLIPVLIFWIPNANITATLLCLYVIFGVAATALINSHIFVKIFDQYIPREAIEDQAESGEGEI